MSSRKTFESTVSCQEVYALAIDKLQRSLAWSDQGYRCTVRNILLVLLMAVCRLGSITDACCRLKNGPCGQAVFNALYKLLPKKIQQLEEPLNQALQPQLPRSFWKKARPVAVDLVDINYYGRFHRQKKELCSGKRRDGTSRFHRYGSLCVLRRGERFTLALTYVWKDDTPALVLKRLLERARAQGLRIRYLLLDREFYNLEVIQTLQAMHCPFVVPVMHRGRKPKASTNPATLKGTRRFLCWTRSGFSSHTMSNKRQQAKVSIAVCQAPATTRSGRRRKKVRPMIFAFWRLRPSTTTWVRKTYRSRYGIETSYRQMNQARARTCSRDPRIRLLLVALGLILRNLWVLLHQKFLSRIRGRGLQLRLWLLRLRTMLLILQHCAEAILGSTEPACNLLQTPALNARPG